MASEAEVDLIISTAGALPELERDLQRIITAAEGSASTLDVEAALNVGASVAALAQEIETVVQRAEAGASEIDLQAALDTARSLAEVQSQLEQIVDQASRGEQINLEAALNLPQSIAQVEAQVRELVAEVEATAPEIDIQTDVDKDGKGARGVTALTKAFKASIGPIGKASGAIFGVGIAAAQAAPLLAGVASAVEAIAPAAALAAPAILTVALAAGTVKLAMNGVADSVKLAFDPNTKPEKLAEALKDLAPEARAFVVELSKMKGGLREIQQTVQNNFFKDFAGTLGFLGDHVLPIFATAAKNTALTLNEMAHAAAFAAIDLGESGALGNALSSANIALFRLRDVPAQVVTAFGQLAAAAGPVFERLAGGAADAATRISEKLTAAFESGGLTRAIDQAVASLGQFKRAIGNFGEGLGNIFATVTQQGGGLFATLEKISQAFADVTATKGFQDALKALVQTGSTLVATVLPLISRALQALGPVFQALGPPVELLIQALGDALGPVIEALSPVLVALAKAFGRLVGVITPFIDLASKLLVALLPALVPLFDAIGQALNAMIPFAKALADSLAAQLVPLFTTLATEVLPKILPPLVELSTKIFPILTEILIKLGPSMVKLGEAFAQIAVALTPLIVQITALAAKFTEDLLPVVQPILDVLIKLVELGLKVLVFQLQTIVIPVIGVLVDLLKGDFHGAWEGAKDIVANVSAKIGELAGQLKDAVVEQLRQLVERVGAKTIEIRDRLVQGFNDMVAKAREVVAILPQVFVQGLANAGQILVSAGADIVRGLISGIQSQLGRLRDIAKQVSDTVAGSVKDFLGIHSPSRVMMEVGDDTVEGFRIGIKDALPDLRKDLQGVAALAPSFALPNGQTLSLPQASADAPVVQVFLGNELINNHVDARIAQSNKGRDRLAITGVRR